MRSTSVLLGAGLCIAVGASAQQPAASDGPRASARQAVQGVDAAWEQAVRRGTRSADGRPGPRYWVQGARYTLQATLEPGPRRVRGSGTLRYYNRSPDTLSRVALQLSQNLFAPGAPSTERVTPTGGLRLQTLCIARLSNAPAATLCRGTSVPGDTTALATNYTIGWVTLPVPLLPGDSLDLQAAWSFTLPGDGAPRMGSDGQVHMVGYWYPQFAVYDDVAGWQVDPYLGTGEFYMDHASYDVRVTVPAGMLVAATGTLQNPEAVLTPVQRERLRRAARSFEPVAIVGRDEPRAAGGTTTWHFTSEQTRDFAFYASRDVVWDAMAAQVTRAGRRDTVLIHGLYRPTRKAWRRVTDFGRLAIEEFSRRYWAYPWPQMTVVEGIVEGGMEYPMLTIITAATAEELFGTTAHEIGHMWFPMQVGTDERRYAWMDEGLADWMQAQAERAHDGGDAAPAELPDGYAMLGGSAEAAMLLPADGYPSLYGYIVASYEKLGVVFRAFAAQYGDSALAAGLRTYGQAWTGRHPYPPDFYRLVFAAAGEEREAFVSEWIRGTGTFDARVQLVDRTRDSVTVRVTAEGGAYTAVPVAILRDGEAPERWQIPARAFRANPVQERRIGRARHLQRVVLDPAGITPDRQRQNNVAAP